MSSLQPRIQTADLQWRDGQPVSAQHGDIYYSTRDGLAESRHVFINGNRLPERWAHRPRAFVIAETGFGSGLNFLATCREWLKHVDRRACLHYCAVENQPFTRDDARHALGRWPELADLLAQWLAVYPPAVHGFHRLELFGGRVRLTLAYMDIAEWAGEIQLAADAWYLDGFAPARNPAMWADPVLEAVGVNTADNGTFATFSAAGAVRRALATAFRISKCPGFAGKREMLCGVKRAGSPAPTEWPPARRPWFAPPPGPGPAAAGERRAVVVGAGLAGAWTADALARRGWAVTVVDRHTQPAGEASGNALGVLYGRFSAFADTGSRFHQQAFLHAVRRFESALSAPGLWHPCGMLRLAAGDSERYRQRRLIEAGLWSPDWLQSLSARQAGDMAGVSLQHGGLFYPRSGWLAPARVCRYLLARDSAVDWRPGRAVQRLEPPAGGRGWRLVDSAGATIAEAPVVILANSADAARFEPTAYLPLKRIRGQATTVSATRRSEALHTVLCYDGYATPAIDGRHSIGATFDPDSGETRCRPGDDRRNLERLAGAEPAVYRALCAGENADRAEPSVAGARVGFRCHAPDYLPVVGPVPDLDAYRRVYAPLARGELKRRYPAAPVRPGLYVNLAHGSRGITSTPLCAEILAAYLCRESQPVPETLRAALHPARLPIKWLKQGRF